MEVNESLLNRIFVTILANKDVDKDVTPIKLINNLSEISLRSNSDLSVEFNKIFNPPSICLFEYSYIKDYIEYSCQSIYSYRYLENLFKDSKFLINDQCSSFKIIDDNTLSLIINFKQYTITPKNTEFYSIATTDIINKWLLDIIDNLYLKYKLSVINDNK